MDSDDQRRIIAEQRDQLIQLRHQLKMKGVGKLTVAVVTELLGKHKLKDNDGKTVGLKISNFMRDRLNEHANKLGASSYRQILMVCIELGLQQLEEMKDATSAVEGVQEVRRPDDPGNRTDPTAN
jgi:predicted DNA-binding protein